MALIHRDFMPTRPIEVGKIKIGTRGRARDTSGGGTSYIPERLDHFLITTLERGGDDGKGPFLKDDAIHAVVGDKPRELFGYLMYPEIEQNLHTEMAVYKGRRRQWSCNGQRRIMRAGAHEPCQRERQCGCKPYSRLHIQLNAASQMGGYYVLRSHGWGTTNNLQTVLEEIFREFHTLYKAPIKLFMQLTEDTYMQGDQERTGKSWKVGACLNMPFEEAQQYLAEQAQKSLQTRRVLMLEAGAVKDDLDAYDVLTEGETADEFGPPKGGEASVGTQARLEEALAKSALHPQEEPAADEGESVEQGHVGQAAGGDTEIEAGEDNSAGSPDSDPRGPRDHAPTREDPGGHTEDDSHPVFGFLQLAIDNGVLTPKQIERCQEAVDGDGEQWDVTASFLRAKLETHGVIKKGVTT